MNPEKTGSSRVQHHVTGKYTVFGHVIDGMEVLDKMEKVPTGDLAFTGLCMVAKCSSAAWACNCCSVCMQLR